MTAQASPVAHKTVTIAEGEAASGVLDLEHFTRVAIFMPAAMDGTSIGIHAAPAKDGTFVVAEDDAGTPIAIPVTVGVAISIDSLREKLAPYRWVKLVSNAAGPGFETAERSFPVLLKA